MESIWRPPIFSINLSKTAMAKLAAISPVAPQYLLIVAATYKNRVMETLPEHGINSIDRFVTGGAGPAVFANLLGEEVLASAKVVPVAGWYMAAVLPTSEAFAPIRGMQQHMQLATLVLTLLAGGLTWWILRRQFSPLVGTAKTLAAMRFRCEPAVANFAC